MGRFYLRMRFLTTMISHEEFLRPVIIRNPTIEPLELMVTQAAAGLRVSRKTLSLLLNGHAGISPETRAPTCPARTCQGARRARVAVRLSKALRSAGSPVSQPAVT